MRSTSEETHQSGYRKLIGFSIFLFSQVIGVIANILVKEAFSRTGVNTFEYSYINGVISTVMFAIFSLLLDINPFSVKKSNILCLVLRSLTGCTNTIVFFYALQMTPLSIFSVLINTSPLFTQLFSKIFLKSTFTKLDVISAIISFFGVCIISLTDNSGGQSYGNIMAYILSILCASLTGVIYTFTKLLTLKGCTTQSMGVFVCTLISICHAPIGLQMKQQNNGLDFTKVFSFENSVLILTPIIIGCFSFILFLEAFKYEKAQKLASLSYINVVMYFAVDIYYYHKTLRLYEVIGSVMIVGSCATLTILKALE